MNELANQIDTILWEDLATIPVFTFPGLEAHTIETVGHRVQPDAVRADLERPGLERRLTHLTR